MQAEVLALHPLRDAGIVGHVFKLLPGNHLFLGAVCRVWKAAYAGTEDQQLRRASLDSHSTMLVTCGTESTLYSAVVASPARARWAASCGLAMHKNKKLQLVAGLHADIETLAALLELGMPLSDTVVEAAALAGRLNMLQHLLTEQRCPVPKTLTYYAARSGSIPILQWLRSEGLGVFNDYTCEGAAEGGHLAVLKHLQNERCEWDAECITGYAAASGNIELVEWLRQQGVEFDDEALSSAAGASQIAMCEHLRALGCEWDEDACRLAVIHRAVDTLRWLREQGSPWDVNEVYQLAACNNQTDVLEYVAEQGELPDAGAMTEALKCAGTYNRLQAAQLIRQHGAAWPAVLGYSKHGAPMAHTQQWHGETLAWARAQGCTAPLADQ
jgi:hypothetical protein